MDRRERGIRPEELQRLDWEDVDFDQGVIHIRKRVLKVNNDRNVPLAENCREWLERVPVRTGLVAPESGFRYRFDAVRRAAGFSVRGASGEAWSSDVLRHSYASYWLALHKNRPQLAEDMGNSVVMIKKHYRRLENRMDSEA